MKDATLVITDKDDDEWMLLKALELKVAVQLVYLVKVLMFFYKPQITKQHQSWAKT